MKEFFKNNLLLFIVLLAFVVRIYGINWDQYQHLHPDERMITMVATNIHFPVTEGEKQMVFTKDSSLNPQFFAYGSFPIYLLSVSGSLASFIDPLYGVYDRINLVGRLVSVFFDLGTLLLLYLIAKRIFGKTVGLLSSLFYAVSVLPIQLSHFYAVDTPLTFFITLGLYLCLRLYHQPTFLYSSLLGITYGLALATKTSALLLIVPIGLSYLLVTRPSYYIHSHLPLRTYLFSSLLHKSVVLLTLTLMVTVVTFIIFEPFALIDLQTFLKHTREQQAMTKDAFTFPYTLQYVGKTPYLYEIQNIFLWGLGPVLATISFLGGLLILFSFTKEQLVKSRNELIILTSYLIAYFVVVGGFAIGFVRYMLPLYPFLALFAGYLIYQMSQVLFNVFPRKTVYTLFSFLTILILLWPISFLSIYAKPNPRTNATEWIITHIPHGSRIATEHWDDGLPIGYQQLYQVNELPLYEPDTVVKWQHINSLLQQTDYIIIASHRLYAPLMRLTNCQTLPPGRCYPQTADYYQRLFSGNSEFKKVAEFTNYPTLPLTNIQINDISSDETFTVYDHPKIMIFKRI